MCVSDSLQVCRPPRRIVAPSREVHELLVVAGDTVARDRKQRKTTMDADCFSTAEETKTPFRSDSKPFAETALRRMC